MSQTRNPITGQLFDSGAAHVLPKDIDGSPAKVAFTPSGTSTNFAFNGSGGAIVYHALAANTTMVRLLPSSGTNWPYIAFKTSAAGSVDANGIHIKNNTTPEVFNVGANTHIAVRSSTATGGSLNIVEM